MDAREQRTPLRPLADVGLACPACAVKHLRAALSYSLNHASSGATGRAGLGDSAEAMMLVSSAYVAFGEYAVGYVFHRNYALGCLVAAETLMAERGRADKASSVRAIRVELECETEPGYAMRMLKEIGADPILGNLAEAVRESDAEFSAKAGLAATMYRYMMVDDTVERKMDLVQYLITVIDEMDGTIYRGGKPSKETDAGGKEVK